MKVTTHSTIIELNSKELDAIRLVDDILGNIQTEFLNDTALISATTGEVILLDEVARVKGILFGLANNSYWDVQRQEEYSNEI